ncbi:hypothetical protein VNO77_17044 [Canavalia gladiata]|uniref:Uncharacterized protein n=1 Tax=Canavalia gladiata TaxID=3824 RepID=A0AAN9LM09_CANGL
MDLIIRISSWTVEDRSQPVFLLAEKVPRLSDRPKSFLILQFLYFWALGWVPRELVCAIFMTTRLWFLGKESSHVQRVTLEFHIVQ